MDPATTLTTRVRELVRERRIDPRADPAAVRQAAQDVVADHERASLTGAVRTIDETDVEVARLVADVAGLGVLQPLVDDPTVEEIWINAPQPAFAQVRCPHHPLLSAASPQQYRASQPSSCSSPAESCPRPWARGGSTCSG